VELTAAGRADPLFAGFASRMETFQWHGAEIRRLPEGAVVLAANAACATQAIRWGRQAYGIQYHVEITSATVPKWQRIPEYAASLEAALGSVGAARLESVARVKLPAFNAAARRIDDNLAAIVTSMAKVTGIR
jgi:GMP synthase-like glutamine amidotransferase